MRTLIFNTAVSFLIFTGVCARPATIAPPKPVDSAIISQLTSIWTNQLGSTLTISNIDQLTGQISGSYRSPSGAGGTEYPLIGWVNTAPANASHPDHVIVVSFSVRWGTIGSVTAWNGIYVANGNPPKIIGQWFLSRPNSDFPWDHVLVGQDQFNRVK